MLLIYNIGDVVRPRGGLAAVPMTLSRVLRCISA